MNDISKLKLFIQEFESNNVPLTKPKLERVKNEAKPSEEVIKEFPPPDNQKNKELLFEAPVKEEKKKRIKSPAQMESLKKAQQIRKTNIQNKNKQKEYESALKLLQYLELEKTKPKNEKPKLVKYAKSKVIKIEESEEELEESEEEEIPIQKQRPMKSMQNKKYSTNNFFV